MIEITVTMPPSVNNLFHNIAGKGRIKSKRYKAWEAENLWALKAQSRGFFEGDVTAHYTLPSTSRQDIDNPCKALGDILEKAGILKNDNQIRKLLVEHEDREDVLVRVEALYPVTIVEV